MRTSLTRTYIEKVMRTSLTRTYIVEGYVNKFD